MMLTEEEAKTKWCPEVIASHTDPRRGFHPGEELKQYHQSGLHVCIGSACMAWRWGGEHTTTGWKDPPVGNGWRLVNEGCAPGNEEYAVRIGYCGKAGKP